MTDKPQQRDRSRVYQAITFWCRMEKASSGLTLASMQGKKCQALPCYDFCSNVDRQEKEE